MRGLPKAVQDEIHALRRRNGTLRPADLVTAAIPETSPLHKYFTWDDQAAARKHRLEEAEQLIRQVRIKIVTSERVINVPAYVHDTKTRTEQRYIFVPRVREDPEEARKALLQELRAVTGWLARCERLALVLGVTPELVEIRERVEVLQESLMQAA